MPHMVICRSADGAPEYHEVEGLEDAARHVEHLRNNGDATDVRIFAMQEVPIEIKAYYKVEVQSPVPAATTVATPVITAEKAAAEKPAVDKPVEAAGQEPASVGNGAGRFGLFGKS